MREFRPSGSVRGRLETAVPTANIANAAEQVAAAMTQPNKRIWNEEVK
jgi:hypothetical protein